VFIVSASRFHSWAHPVEQKIHSSLFIGAFMAIHSFGPSTGRQTKCFIDLIIAIHSKVYFKESFKIARALTDPNQRYLAVQG